MKRERPLTRLHWEARAREREAEVEERGEEGGNRQHWEWWGSGGAAICTSVCLHAARSLAERGKK